MFLICFYVLLLCFVYITYVRLARATVSVRTYLVVLFEFFYCYLLLCDLLYAAFKQIKIDRR